ncbi:MAG: 16S rRNA (cytosine(1402)-N(4))-methyltransferase RsmH [Hyphomicrobiaceae bacterium]|nr:16S rRNA (cytosine(1402)-N(4))-methyltransferase RsmH [Hyphomicrobiaceae bacterium]
MSAVSAPHIPVLLGGVLKALSIAPGQTVVDGTFGAGGYSGAFLEKGARVIAFDRDPRAIAGGAELAAKHPGLTLIEAPFGTMAEELSARGIGGVDAVVLDIGVSSMQLDQAERGFSFRLQGPLDMRMGADGTSAADIVNEADFAELAEIFHLYGEERFAGPIARAIVRRREQKAFTTTTDLADLVAASVPRRGKEVIHPATRVFQALRIAVNDELGELVRALDAAEALLKEGGILAVVTFHSLEDRIVKRFLSSRSETRAGGSRHMPEQAVAPATFEAVPRRPVLPDDAEMAANPRARSAKLRYGTRTAAPLRISDPRELGLPRSVHLMRQGI